MYITMNIKHIYSILLLLLLLYIYIYIMCLYLAVRLRIYSVSYALECAPLHQPFECEKTLKLY